jgi:aminoglycoside 3-N-acetyltransferase I
MSIHNGFSSMHNANIRVKIQMIMNKPIHIQHLSSLSDVKALISVFTLAFGQGYTVTDEYLSKMLEDDRTLVLGAFEDTEILGGLVAIEMRPIHGSKEFYIYDIAVHPEHQKQGIGKALIEHLTQEARKKGIETIFVEAESEDEDAVAFYRALGGEEVSVNHFNFTT